MYRVKDIFDNYFGFQYKPHILYSHVYCMWTLVFLAKEQSPLLTTEDRELLERWTNMAASKSISDSTTASEQTRAVLSPKNNNYVTQVVTMPTGSVGAADHMMRTQAQLGAYGGYDNTRPQVYLMQSYLGADTVSTGTTRMLSTPSSQLNVPQGSTLGPIYNQPTQQHNLQSHTANQPNSLSMQGNNFTTAANTSPVSIQGDANAKQQDIVHQMMFQSQPKPPPDYTHAIHTNNQMKSTDLNVGTQSSQPSPSDFLPFQTYDGSSAAGGFINSACAAQLTPDLSLFDSPTTSTLTEPNHTISDPAQSQSVITPELTFSQDLSTHNEAACGSSHGAVGGHSNAITSTLTTGVDGGDGMKDNNAQMLSIITQMKRSHVNDPLLLTLTPKTAGEPYGVGPEILPDVFLPGDRYVINSTIYIL